MCLNERTNIAWMLVIVAAAVDAAFTNSYCHHYSSCSAAHLTCLVLRRVATTRIVGALRVIVKRVPP